MLKRFLSRVALATCVLALLAGGAAAADLGPVITTTDGCRYVKASDGKYYPADAPVSAAVPAQMPGCTYCSPCTCAAGVCPACPTATAAVGTGDGLDEVNAKRAARGLRPFVRDEGLAQAARACAAARAERGLFGHTSNDFGFLPPGARADAAGCAAYPASYGWMSCCTYENYTHAGAAWVTGRDGRRYMHLFVSHGGGTSATAAQPGYLPAAAPAAQPACPSCQGGSCPAPAPSRRGLFR
jgi:hypothetical protein